MNRRAQAMSIDLGVSIVLFTVAVAVTYGLLENTLTQSAYEDVRREAIDVSDVLISDGYPSAWTNTTVLRAGIVSQGAISMRKIRELAGTERNDLRQSVRATDNVVITVHNATGNLEAISGACAVGDLVVTPTPATRALPAVALVRDPHPVADGTNATQYETDTVLDAYDTIIIEGNLTKSTTRTSVQIARDLATAAQHGITIVIIGDPGVPLLGVSVNYSNATTITVSDAQAAHIGLSPGDITLFGGAEGEIPTINQATASEVSNWVVLGTTEDDAIAIATWTYNDARIWYVATSEGILTNGTALVDILQAGAESHITVSWPSCGELVIPDDATAVARYDRALAYHDQILTLRVIVWRNY